MQIPPLFRSQNFHDSIYCIYIYIYDISFLPLLNANSLQKSKNLLISVEK